MCTFDFALLINRGNAIYLSYVRVMHPLTGWGVSLCFQHSSSSSLLLLPSQTNQYTPNRS